MQAVVVAAGLGSRLYPFSDIIPKLMLPAGKRQLPVGEYIINHCMDNGIYDFVFCINNEKAPQITNFFKDGKRFGADIQYSISEKPMGTAGELAIAYSAGLIDARSSIIYYGDILCKTDISKMIQEHKEADGDISIVINSSVRIPVGYTEDIDGMIYTIIEKPKISDICISRNRKAVSGGILPIFYVTNKDFYNNFCKTGIDVVNDVFTEMLQRGYKLLSYHDHADFIDMGSFKNLEIANKQWE